MKSQRRSRKTFGAQFIIRRMRGKGGSSGFRDEVPKMRLGAHQPSVKTETLKTETSKTETFVKSHHLSRETFGARFIVHRMRGTGGPVAFATRSPKCGLI